MKTYLSIILGHSDIQYSIINSKKCSTQIPDGVSLLIILLLVNKSMISGSLVSKTQEIHLQGVFKVESKVSSKEVSKHYHYNFL